MPKKPTKDNTPSGRAAARLQADAVAKGEINLYIRSFSQREVLDLLPDVNEGRLQNWLARGVISIGGPTQGSGHHRQWCGLEVIQLKALATLTQLGLPVSEAAKLAELVNTRAQHVISPAFVEDERGMMIIRGLPTPEGVRYDAAYENEGDVAESLRGIFAATVIRPDVVILEVTERMVAYLAQRQEQEGQAENEKKQ